MYGIMRIRKMNKRAAEESPKYNPKADDWDTVVQEDKTGCCARCGQALPANRESRPRLYELGDRRISA